MRRLPAFITTPIFYANAEPHLGHAYTLCVADAWSRFSAIRHHPSLQVFPPRQIPMRPQLAKTGFLCTGVDEHGSKIEQTAAMLHCTPKDLCDRVSLAFKATYSSLSDGLKQRLEQSGHLYWSTFAGWYSNTDETFYGDWEVTDSPSRSGVKVARITGNEVHWMEEKTCRFRLVDFKDRLHMWLDSGVLPKKSPEHARLLSLMHSTLNSLDDPSVSRPASRVPWGIRVPGQPEHTIYVWFDALINYLTAGGVPLNATGDSGDAIWPPDWQFIGKDILRFHTILWPAVLLALELPLPKKIIPHGHILVDGTKMSKSLGNVVNPCDALGHFVSALSSSTASTLSETEKSAMAADCLRYCLVRSVCLHEDTTFSLALATEIVNTELVNWLGNLLSRVTSEKIVPSQSVPILDLAKAQDFMMSDPADAAFFNDLWDLPAKFDTLWWDHLQPNRCIDTLMQVVRQTNAFVDRHRPWEKRDSSSIVVGVALEALRLFGCLLTPVIPSLSNRLFCGLGIQPGALRCSSWKLSSILRQPFLPRIKV